jgi:hypothetical protein
LEPEVHLIEKYFQEILHCLTITNTRCKGGKEIDLLAVDPRTLRRFHVESRVATKFLLKSKATYRKNGSSLKNGVDYFIREKFDHPHVKERIGEIFGEAEYERVLVVWDVSNLSVVNWAKQNFGLDIWFIDDLLEELIEKVETLGSRDDILRVVELMALSERRSKKFGKPYVRKLARLGLGAVRGETQKACETTERDCCG